MFHKRKFGQKGVVAVLMHSAAYADTELMGRLDMAANQFGVTHDYQFDFFMSKTLPWSRAGHRELFELAGRACAEKYKVIIAVGPEAVYVLSQVTAMLRDKRMTIGVDSWAALDNKAPHQFEMANMHEQFFAHVSNLIRVCLEHNLSQDEGVEYVRKYEESRQHRDWGLFDDCYVIVTNRSGGRQMVRFEDKDDVLLPPPPEHPFKGRDRVILFQA